MLIKNNTIFRIDDIYEDKDNIVIFTNKKPAMDILKKADFLGVKKLTKTAKVITVAPKEDDFLYVRNRAISAGNVIEQEDGIAKIINIDDIYKDLLYYKDLIRGANANGDFFTDTELKAHYKTFIGKPVFVDHNNENIEEARGVIIDSVYNERGQFVELLKAVDKKAYPELANGIIRKYITDTSMGCRCGYSLCSICGNKAVDEEDFCEHVKNHKGGFFEGKPVWEDNREIEFFEDSFVTQGADPQAKILEKVASRNYNKVNRHSVDNSVQRAIREEKNQRYTHNRVNKFSKDLEGVFTI